MAEIDLAFIGQRELNWKVRRKGLPNNPNIGLAIGGDSGTEVINRDSQLSTAKKPA